MKTYKYLIILLIEFISTFIILSFAFALSYYLGGSSSIPGITKGFPFIIGIFLAQITFSQKNFLKEKAKKVSALFSATIAIIMFIPDLSDLIYKYVGKLFLFFSSKVFLIANYFIHASITNPFDSTLDLYTLDIGTYFIFGLGILGLFPLISELKKTIYFK